MLVHIHNTESWDDKPVDKYYLPILEKYNYTEENGLSYIEINNLQELIQLTQEIDELQNSDIQGLIINSDGADTISIEIYDDYRE